MNEVASVTRRIIEGLLTGTNVPVNVAKAFEGGSKALEEARGKLRKGSNIHLAIGHNVIRAYLGNGDPAKSPRGERASVADGGRKCSRCRVRSARPSSPSPTSLRP
jgi:hypothetical protein